MKGMMRENRCKIVGLMACTARRGVIGRQGKIPWNIPKEMQHFQRMTAASIVIMGRRTFEEMSGLELMEKRVGVVVSSRLAAAAGQREDTRLCFLRRSAERSSRNDDSGALQAGDAVVATCVRDFVDRVFPSVVKRAVVQADKSFLIGGNDLASEMLEMGLVDEFILSLIEQVRLPLQLLWALVSMAGWLLQKSLQSLFSVSLLCLSHLPHHPLTGIFWRHLPQLSTSFAGKVCAHPA